MFSEILIDYIYIYTLNYLANTYYLILNEPEPVVFEFMIKEP